jgi:DNA-binding NtrC family response regulator
MTIARRSATPIDLLITDVVMPGGSGPELFQALAAERRATKVLYMSGYPDDALADHGRIDSSVAYLQKPFSSSALMRKIREVLERT